jgi:hypothetical protein
VSENHPHKIRHHHHHHNHHRRKSISNNNDDGIAIPPPTLNHVDPSDDDLILLPLYPKNISEETRADLKRLKRQYFSHYDEPYAPSQQQQYGAQQPQFYVTEDGSEWRDDGRGDQWSAASPCSRSCGGGVSYQERICRDPLRF